jgi:hypothetical protein
MSGKQSILAAEIGLREGMTHPVAIGDINERGWQRALERFLPPRYKVSRGAFIVDSDGEESLEIDLVVHDNYFHPELFEAADRSLIPRESVYAVFEVKPELSKAYLEYAIKRAASVRRLKPTSIGFVDARGHIGEPRPALRPLAGLLAVRSSWTDPFGASFADCLTQAEPDGALDLGCGLEHGAFEVQYPFEEETPVPAAAKIVTSSADTGLIYLLSHLSHRLIELGSVPAIDIRAYTDQLEKTDGGRVLDQ